MFPDRHLHSDGFLCGSDGPGHRRAYLVECRALERCKVDRCNFSVVVAQPLAYQGDIVTHPLSQCSPCVTGNVCGDILVDSRQFGQYLQELVLAVQCRFVTPAVVGGGLGDYRENIGRNPGLGSESADYLFHRPGYLNLEVRSGFFLL